MLDLVEQVVMALLLQSTHPLLQEQVAVEQVIEVMMAHHLVQVRVALQVLAVVEQVVAPIQTKVVTEQLTLELVAEAVLEVLEVTHLDQVLVLVVMVLLQVLLALP